MVTIPTAEPVRFPAEYGQGEAVGGGLLAWEDVATWIAASPNYWLATTAGDGRPYLRPVDGVFVDATLAFGGSPATRWVRHLQRRPSVSASLPDPGRAVILEGRVELITGPTAAIAEPVAAANRAKYPQYYGEDAGFRPFWALRPRQVYAWTLADFPARATRFDFAADQSDRR